jgi:hypothetical protein
MKDTPRILFDSELIDEELRKLLEAALAQGQISESRQILSRIPMPARVAGISDASTHRSFTKGRFAGRRMSRYAR